MVWALHQSVCKDVKMYMVMLLLVSIYGVGEEVTLCYEHLNLP